MSSPVALALTATLALSLLIPAPLAAQNVGVDRVYGRYQQTVWQEQHGLPQNTVFAITGTRDGYLWLGTQDGAARFDGVRFTPYNANTRAIPGTIVFAALEDRSGALWLGTDNGGVARYKDGRFTTFTTTEGLLDNHPRVLFESSDGDLWVGTIRGLNRFSGGRWSHYTEEDGLPHSWVTSLAEDRDGTMWIGTEAGLATLKDGQLRAVTPQEGAPRGGIRALKLDRAGRLWIGTDTQVARREHGRFVAGAAHGLPQVQALAIHEDRQGSLWIGTGYQGLLRAAGDRFVRYTSADGLPSDMIRAIYESADGDIWIGTGGGLVRLRTARVKVLTTADGLARDYSTSILRGTGRDMWVAASDGLVRFRDGTPRRFTTRDGLPATQITAMTRDTEGRTVVSTAGAVGVFEGDRFVTRYVLPPEMSAIRTILVDRTGALWIGTVNGGVIVQQGGETRTFSIRDGLRDDQVLALHEDRDGGIWVATITGGVSRIANGRVTSWTTAEGLAHDQVLTFYEARDGAMWIGTHGGGLTRFKDGRLATVGVGAGLFNGVIFRIIEDDSGQLWMSCNKGIFRVSLRDLDLVADGRQSRLISISYGIADGMPSSDCNQGFPAGDRLHDGSLWFPTPRGVVVVDPNRHDVQPPRVAIEQVTLDREPAHAPERLEVPPGQHSVEIAYTGLSWARPDQVRFRYRLAGLDQAWHEPGTRRTAFYPYLPPGSYTFTVIADNGEGVWNSEGASLPVTVLPALYQTRWFRGGAASLLVLSVIVAWQIRARRFRAAQAVRQTFSRQLIASQEHERKRIAGELHDGLGQHLVVIRNLALLQSESGDPDARRALQDISSEASSALSEVRSIAYNLRPYQLDRLGLAKALEAVIAAASQVSNTTFETLIDAVEGAVAKEREIDIYRIVQEAVNNIVKHAAATEATVSAERLGASLRLTIHDNGRGFTPGGPRPELAAGGFGLLGLSERTQLLGGTFNVTSSPGAGTTITIDVPTYPGHGTAG